MMGAVSHDNSDTAMAVRHGLFWVAYSRLHVYVAAGVRITEEPDRTEAAELTRVSTEVVEGDRRGQRSP